VPKVAWHEALSATVLLDGQVTLGAVTSLAVTTNEQVAVLPLPSLAVKVTVWVLLWPVSKVADAGLWVTVGDGLQLSDTLLAE
jgi:hypothetical protein